MARKKRYRTSPQRERILELLRNTDIHPTADWVYEQLKKEFPKLSLGTVYRNIRILVQEGLLQRIPAGSTFDRFDGNLKTHYHVICDQCGKIVDLDIPVDETLEKKVRQCTDFTILRHRVEFHGICPECQSKTKKGGLKWQED